jgi:hypothetical protein
MKLWFIRWIFLTLVCSKTYSQSKNSVGLDFQFGYQPATVVNWEYATIKTYTASAISGFGIVYERLLSKNLGFEIETKYQNSPNEYTFYVPEGVNSVAQVKVAGIESSLSIPILFKYNSNILNFSFGPSFQYFIGWNRTAINYTRTYIVTSSFPKYFFPDKWSMGLLAKISKSINFGNKCIVEPGIFYSPIISYNNNYFGLSVIIKHPF